MGIAHVPFENILSDVLLFMTIGQKDKLGAQKIGQDPSPEINKARYSYIFEEVNLEALAILDRTFEAINSTKKDHEGNTVEIGPANLSLEQKAELLDGYLDSIYVIVGGMLEFGFHDQDTIWKCWREVQRSNMSKYVRVPVGYDQAQKDVLVQMNMPEGRTIGKTQVIFHNSQFGEFIIYRDVNTGKILKPSTWTPPKIYEILLDSVMRRDALDHPDNVNTMMKEIGSGPYGADKT